MNTLACRCSKVAPQRELTVLTAKRWEILGAMTGQGEMTIRNIAQRVGRDVKAVHGDVQALLLLECSTAATPAA
jgi:hypothetical protein